jgi:hypothetical protein
MGVQMIPHAALAALTGPARESIQELIDVLRPTLAALEAAQELIAAPALDPATGSAAPGGEPASGGDLPEQTGEPDTSARRPDPTTGVGDHPSEATELPEPAADRGVGDEMAVRRPDIQWLPPQMATRQPLAKAAGKDRARRHSPPRPGSRRDRILQVLVVSPVAMSVADLVPFVDPAADANGRHAIRAELDRMEGFEEVRKVAPGLYEAVTGGSATAAGATAAA